MIDRHVEMPGHHQAATRLDLPRFGQAADALPYFAKPLILLTIQAGWGAGWARNRIPAGIRISRLRRESFENGMSTRGGSVRIVHVGAGVAKLFQAYIVSLILDLLRLAIAAAHDLDLPAASPYSASPIRFARELPALRSIECPTYTALLDVCRARKDALNISFETLDSLSGVAAGYSVKILGPTPCKTFGPVSFAAIMGALALRVVVSVDEVQAARLRPRWTPREMLVPASVPRTAPQKAAGASAGFDSLRRARPH